MIYNIPGNTFILGGCDTGVLYAVYSFLEKVLGIRWFYPDVNDEIIPSLLYNDLSETLSAPFCNYENPSFKIRMISLFFTTSVEYINVLILNA